MPITKQNNSASAGDVKPWLGTSAPGGWIKCNGAAISRSLYAALFNIIGTTYGAGDGSTTFNLPDFRGEFIRGLDDGRGIDSGRTIGNAQSDAFSSHSHTGTSDTHPGHSHTSPVYLYGGGANNIGSSDNATGKGTMTTSTSGAHSHALTINATGSTETRPRNQAALYVIKY